MSQPPQMDWSVVSVCCGMCEIKCPFTANGMTLEGSTKTKGNCAMNEGLPAAGYHDNNPLSAVSVVFKQSEIL